jgi:hypothetical protein
MAVILKTLMAGPAGVHIPGEKVDTFTPEQERVLVAGGFAVYVKQPARGETAEAPPRENAAMPAVKRRGK